MEGGGYMRKQDTLLLMIAVSGEMPADLAEHIIGSVSYTAAVITRLKQEGYISVRNKAGYKGYVLRAKGKRYVLSQYSEDAASFLQGSVETNHVKTEIEKRLRLHRMSKVWVFLWKTGIPIFRSQKPELFCSDSENGRGQAAYYGSLEFKGLTDAIKGLPYDPKNEYSIPYFWGTVGIVYDKTKVSKEDLENEGWNIFLDQKYKGDIYLYDSERDSFMMALKALGYSMNTTSEEELNEAYNWLVNCVQTMDPEIVTDEIIDNMAQARKALGLIYSGDAAYVMAENDKMGFYMPKSGTNLWSDAMVIPKNAKNPKLANEFVRYITSYDAAMDNSSYVGYTSPNKEVMEELGGKGGDYDGINAYTPRAGYDKDEVFQYDEATRKIIADLWSRVKVAASNAH